jgi:hypothetical protein
MRLWCFIKRLDTSIKRRDARKPRLVVVSARQAGAATGVNGLIHVDFRLSSADDKRLDADGTVAHRDLRGLQ